MARYVHNRGDKFSNLLYVKDTGYFLKFPHKFQTHYATSSFIINLYYQYQATVLVPDIIVGAVLYLLKQTH